MQEKPSPSMGEGWVGVDCETRLASRQTPPPPQPLPIEGRGYKASLTFTPSHPDKAA
jgi:hypothetical protein